MQEEQDTCRICSAPAEPDQPLFYPCKCSGTIRYIHQDCLTTWLAHSKKKTCDVCKHPYSFTKVYATDMPERLPPVLLIRQLSRQMVSAVLFSLRAVMVGIVWLAVLPLATIWTWRMYFMMGHSTAWWISNRPRISSESSLHTASSSNDSTVSAARLNTTSPSPVLSHPSIRTISADIVSGQIIASLIVLAFVAIFLLREWISQNARPGIFEDADVPPEAPEQQAPAPVPPQQPPALQEVVRPRAPVIPAEALRARGLRHTRLEERRAQRAAERPAPWQVNGPGEPPKYSPNKKIRHLDDVEAEGEGSSGRRDKGKRVERRSDGSIRLRPPHLRRRGSPGSPAAASSASGEAVDEDARIIEQWEEHLTEWADTLNKAESEGTEDPQKPLPLYRPVPTGRGGFAINISRRQGNTPALLNLDPEKTRFTFTVPKPPPPEPEPAVPDELPSLLGLEKEHRLNWLSSGLHLPPQSERNQGEASSQDNEEPVPPLSLSQPSPSMTPSDTESVPEDLPATVPVTPVAETPGSLRRPPLPGVWIPPLSGTSASASRSRVHTPLASPSLATYRAPEEFEAGPSDIADYFDGDTSITDRAEMEAEHRRYFAPVDEVNEEEKDEEETGSDDRERHRWSDNDMQDFEPEDVEADAWGRELERRVDLAAHAPAVPAVEQAGIAVEEGRPPDINDDLDANLEDDMDGAMEAIGLRGPLHGVLQNAALMIFILDATIGLGVFVPFTIGKSAALLCLDPRRIMQILHLPLRAIRIVTDPVVDSVIMLITRALLPSLAHTAWIASGVSIHALGSVIGHGMARSVARSLEVVYQYVLQAGNWIWDQVTVFLASIPDKSPSDTTDSVLDRVLRDDSVIMRLIEPSFAPIGQTVRLRFEDLRLTWLRLAIGDGPNEKVFAVLLGYAVVGILIAIYLNILTVGSVRNAGRAVRSAVRQQLLVVKVAAFIVVELVVFPLGCGVMLDLCVLWLFPQGNFRDRAAFLTFAPVTSTFYHWVIGTMFMYQFAILLAGCRGIMRPGSMWFIKDPQDQNFHPIRDILERPTLVQLRKLLLSAVMYGLVVAAGVGTVSGILRLFSHIVMPFRWKIREPLSAVPIDLLFLHFVLPYTLHYFRPKAVLQQFGVQLWRYLARQLRLTSYMFGERRPSEEFTPMHWSWRVLFSASDIEMDDAEATRDGSFWRVPNSDNIALVKDSPAIAEVDEGGNPVNDVQANLIATQNAEAEKAKRIIKDDYVIVYMPPQFKYRVTAFIFGVWMVGSSMLAMAVAAPIALGRGFFRLFIAHEVHDGYSFIAGFYLLWVCWLVAYALERMDRRRQRRSSGDERRAEWPLYVVKRILLWSAKAAYIAFFCGFVIPTLLALVIEFYIVQPVRLMMHPAPEIHIRIVDMWAIGLLYSKIGVRSMRMQPGTDIMRGIQHILHNGWTNPDPWKATKQVIAPLTAGLLSMLLLPAGAVWGVRRIFPLLIEDDFLFVHVYPTLFTAAGFIHAAVTCSTTFKSWSQSIRDKEFLVEMRLRNLEPVPEQEREKWVVQLVDEEEEE
ncbi:hypothetical protein B0H21DRAFT_764612 [Amylocystis lapponica]|nr:hypothetical protein B0H21DRAFT_764612 [Amylocystis lapponica]